MFGLFDFLSLPSMSVGASDDLARDVPFIEEPRFRQPLLPLHPTQRQELIELRYQIAARLKEQRLLLASLRRMSQFPVGAAALDTVVGMARDRHHLPGPAPLGDLPADDPLASDDLLPHGASCSFQFKKLGTFSSLQAALHGQGTWTALDGEHLVRFDRSAFLPMAALQSNSCEPRVVPRISPSATCSIGTGFDGMNHDEPSLDISQLSMADTSQMGTSPPSGDARVLIEGTLRKVLHSVHLRTLLPQIVGAFREWTVDPNVAFVQQGGLASTGPALCILVSGVVDVLHRPQGSRSFEKVCTYDRCGQCFGEVELLFCCPRCFTSLDPRLQASCPAQRKFHWATVATRTIANVWSLRKDVLRSQLRGYTPSDSVDDSNVTCLQHQIPDALPATSTVFA